MTCILVSFVGDRGVLVAGGVAVVGWDGRVCVDGDYVTVGAGLSLETIGGTD